MSDILKPNQYLEHSDIIEWQRFFEIPGDDHKCLQKALKLNLTFAKQSMIGGIKCTESTDKIISESNNVDREKIIKQLIIKDLRASQLLSTGADYLGKIDNADQSENRIFETLRSDLEIMEHEDFIGLLQHVYNITNFSKSCVGKNLTAANCPLWVFLLLESEVFPFSEFAHKLTILTPPPLLPSKDAGDCFTNYYGYPSADRDKLGPVASLIIAEVVRASILSSDINFYQSMDELEDECKLQDILKSEYQNWITDEPRVTVGKAIQFVQDNIKLQQRNNKMYDAKFWGKSKGYAISETICNEGRLLAYHPPKHPRPNTYPAKIKEINKKDYFQLDLHNNDWDKAFSDDIRTLKFYATADYSSLLAIPDRTISFNGFVLLSWMIKHEKDDNKKDVFIDDLLWGEGADLIEGLEKNSDGVIDYKEAYKEIDKNLRESSSIQIASTARRVATSWRWIQS